MVEALQPGEKESRWTAPKPDKPPVADLRYLGENDQDDQIPQVEAQPAGSESKKPVPDTAIISEPIAHEAALAAKRLDDVEETARRLGVATGESGTSKIDSVRAEIFRAESDKDKTARFVSAVLSDTLVGRVSEAITREKSNSKALDFERHRSVDLFQPKEVGLIGMAVGPANEDRHPEFGKAARELQAKDYEASKAAAEEGQSLFCEQMTGVPGTKMKEAYKSASDTLSELEAVSIDKTIDDNKRIAAASKLTALRSKLNSFQHTTGFKTIDSHITMPSAIIDNNEYAKYYYDKAPDSAPDAAGWLSDVRGIEAEARDFIDNYDKPKEDPPSVDKVGEAESTEPPAVKKSWLDRLRGK